MDQEALPELQTCMFKSKHRSESPTDVAEPSSKRSKTTESPALNEIPAPNKALAPKKIPSLNRAPENQENSVVQSGKLALSAVDISMPKVVLTSQQVLDLARYTTWLEEKLVPKEEVIDTTLNNTIGKGIMNAMLWKISCVTRSSKFCFVGVCNDQAAMAGFLKMDVDEVLRKTKKHIYRFTRSEFQDNILGYELSVRVDHMHSTLVLGERVSLAWNVDTGEYKVTGTYGIPPNSCFQIFQA